MGNLEMGSGGKVSLGAGDLQIDAWGAPKVSLPKSLIHGLFTFDVPSSMWMIEEDDAEIANDLSTGATSANGALRMDTSGLTSVFTHTRRHPRYQPNRGHLWSSALILPDKTNGGVREFGVFTKENGVFFRLKSDGFLYAVIRSAGVDVEELITIPANMTSFDVEKGNIYDIQFQWRGVGNYYFYIGNPDTGVQQLVHTMDNLGKLTGLSLENPALPAAFKATKITQDVVMLAGCVDVTSENGSPDREQYGSAIGDASVGADQPIVSIRSPLLINGKGNTRDIRLARISASSDKRATIRVWRTRDTTALTGAAFVALGNGSYTEKDVTASALDTAKAVEILQFKVEANASQFANNPSKDSIDFFLTHGDYIIVTGTGATAAVTTTVEFGEEV